MSKYLRYLTGCNTCIGTVNKVFNMHICAGVNLDNHTSTSGMAAAPSVVVDDGALMDYSDIGSKYTIGSNAGGLLK
jgi:hypothetical protein